MLVMQQMNQETMMQLHSCNSLRIERPMEAGEWRCLLVSDLHLAQRDGASYFPARAGDGALSEGLRSVVQRENPRQLFLLGDVFHASGHAMVGAADSSFYAWTDSVFERILSALAGSSVAEVYALGGNHDRMLFAHCGSHWQAADASGKLTVFSGTKAPLLLELASTKSGSKPSVFLTHDGGNALWLEPGEVAPFLRGLRAANRVPDESWLIAGHTHRATSLLPACKAASLGCFTACSKHSAGLDYGMLTEDDTEGFVFRAGNGPRIW